MQVFKTIVQILPVQAISPIRGFVVVVDFRRVTFRRTQKKEQLVLSHGRFFLKKALLTVSDEKCTLQPTKKGVL